MVVKGRLSKLRDIGWRNFLLQAIAGKRMIVMNCILNDGVPVAIHPGGAYISGCKIKFKQTEGATSNG